MDRLIRDAALGAVAGVVGTIAMTTLMKPGLGRFFSTKYRPEEFVPKQVVQWAEERLGRPRHLTENQEMVIAALAHLGYGKAMGALYGALRSGRERLPAPVAGATWGFLVWVIGYEGWLPAAGIRPATTAFPASRWPLPIANHLLFGVVTALAFERLREAAPFDGDSRRKEPLPPKARARALSSRRSAV